MTRFVWAALTACVDTDTGVLPEASDPHAALDVQGILPLLWSEESDLTHSLYMSSVSTAGDVNGDGYDEIVIGGAYFDDLSQYIERVRVFSGTPTGPETTASWTVEADQLMSGFGSEVGSAGDVNGDGFGDVVVVELDYDNGSTDEGRVHVYLGSAAGLDTSASWTFETDQDEAGLASAAGAGDVDADGFGDLVVGAHTFTNGSTHEGRVWLYLGSASGLDTVAAWIAEPDLDEQHFGRFVSSAGDVNGDGFDDVAVAGVNRQSCCAGDDVDTGRVYLFYGTAVGLESVPVWTMAGEDVDNSPIVDDAGFGWSITGAGDVNGDGYDDVVFGAPYFTAVRESEEGRAWLFHGSPDGLGKTPAWKAEGDAADTWLGASVASAGDVNADGYDDVVVGSAKYDPPNDLLNDPGLTMLFLGSSAGVESVPIMRVSSEKSSGFHGSDVSSAGDVNGDGYSDIVTMAIRNDTGIGIEGGAAWVYGGGCIACTPSITPADPGIAGQNNAWALSDAPPGVDVVWLWGKALGAAPAAGCVGVDLGLANPKSLGTSVTDAAGRARLVVNIPLVAGGNTMHVQALLPGSCLVSTVVTTTFQ